MDEMYRRLDKHFTPGELVEFLGIGMREVYEAFDDKIKEHYVDLADEVLLTLDVECDWR